MSSFSNAVIVAVFPTDICDKRFFIRSSIAFMIHKCIKSILLYNFDIRNNSMQKIRFYFHDRKTRLKARKRLKPFIENIFNKEGKELSSLSYIFCSDKYLLAINRD